MLRLVGFEGTGVEVACKKGLALVGDTIQTAGDTLDKAVACQQRQSVAGVRFGRHVERLLQSKWGEVPLLLDCLEDALIYRYHPICTLSHILGVLRMAHMCADGRSDGAYLFIDGAIQAVATAE